MIDLLTRARAAQLAKGHFDPKKEDYSGGQLLAAAIYHLQAVIIQGHADDIELFFFRRTPSIDVDYPWHDHTGEPEDLVISDDPNETLIFAGCLVLAEMERRGMVLTAGPVEPEAGDRSGWPEDVRVLLKQLESTVRLLDSPIIVRSEIPTYIPVLEKAVKRLAALEEQNLWVRQALFARKEESTFEAAYRIAGEWNAAGVTLEEEREIMGDRSNADFLEIAHAACEVAALKQELALCWRPIDTAPKDGTHVLGRDQYGHAYPAAWQFDAWCDPHTGVVVTSPVEWRALP